jgi:hypothetical protein
VAQKKGEIMGDIRFRPLDPAERDKLRASLYRNVTDGASLLTGRDTSFLGDAPIVSDDEVIRAIKSVPCHYAELDPVGQVFRNLRLTAAGKLRQTSPIRLFRAPSLSPSSQRNPGNGVWGFFPPHRK